MTLRLTVLAALSLLVFGASMVNALGPSEREALPEALKERVQNIPNANKIRGLEQIDNKHVVVSLEAEGSYLLTLTDACHGLTLASEIGVTVSNNTIWAGFDAVTANGLQCNILSIDRIE